MAQQKNNARLYDPTLLIQAGINPKTKMPAKATAGNPVNLKENIRRALRIVDQQDAVNRYTWYNLPGDINGQLVERMLYYKGQLCFFYFEEIDQFVITPYTLDSSDTSTALDFYGRYRGIKPVPLFNAADNAPKEEKQQAERLRVLLSSKHLKPIYDPITPEELLAGGKKLLTDSCVIIKDYTEQLPQTITPRQIVNEGIIDFEAECMPFMRTALIRATGVRGMRVGDPTEQSNVAAANNSIEQAALTGKVNIPIVGTVDFQELNDGQVGKADEFMMALQSIENFRLGLYGLENGGIFQKRERKLVDEQNMNGGGGSVSLILQDGLSNRQRFCDTVNSIWGIGIWCDISETASGTDKNMDGELSDQKDQSGIAGDQPKEVSNV